VGLVSGEIQQQNKCMQVCNVDLKENQMSGSKRIIESHVSDGMKTKIHADVKPQQTT